MKRLEVHQMEGINGGKTALQDVNCAIGLIGFGVAAVGLVTATGGIALAAAVVGYSIAPVGAALSCLT